MYFQIHGLPGKSQQLPTRADKRISILKKEDTDIYPGMMVPIGVNQVQQQV
jgi:hypothetical protein